MRKKQGLFPRAYLFFVLLLTLLTAASILYVHSLLVTYEQAQPERLVEEAIAALTTRAEEGTLFPEGTLPAGGRWEAEISPQKEYAARLREDGVRYTPKAGLHAPDELVYSVKTASGFPLAEITLQSVGEPVTKLAVFTWQEWELKAVMPMLIPTTYTLTLPSDFAVTVNGLPLTVLDGISGTDGTVQYTLEGLYFRPVLRITNENGETAEYSFKGEKIVPVIYDYALTLPASLEIRLNGTVLPGEPTGTGHILYDIRMLTKPDITISDRFGNTVSYEGGNSLPLTYLTLETTDQYTVTVNGSPVPDTAVTARENAEYAAFSAYAANLPRLLTYDLAILQADADIAITDPDGNPVVWDKSAHTLDLTRPVGKETVPDSIAAEVDVLAIAEKWSLFVSNDLAGANNGFAEIAQYLIPSSYQYEIATAYANGTDIQFTSIHTLKDPPFTEETVTNFIRLTEDCFSVDVSFNKHMILYYGTEVVDPMNERLYFVKYDDPADTTDTPAWKLASMKELGGYAE